jgi:SAM-dependent methyltransferase
VNSTLRSVGQVRAAVGEARRLRLPPVWDAPKTWDSLGALHEVLTRTSPDARVLDAGAETYSRILPWLYLYGYRELTGINLVFERTRHLGPIAYEPGDLTSTRFPPGHFDAVTCLSVIEHGVDLECYFREMARVIKPGGVLVTSTDYFDEPTATDGRRAFGVPVQVFDRQDITGAFAVAERHGFELSGPVDLSSPERCVHWAEVDLRYTFLIFSLIRR